MAVLVGRLIYRVLPIEDGLSNQFLNVLILPQFAETYLKKAICKTSWIL